MDRVRDVVIVGRDAQVWQAALLVLQLVGKTGIRVSVVELPPLANELDVIPTLPSQQGLHRFMGLNEGSMISRCGATYTFGQRFVGWGLEMPAFMHAYDSQGLSLHGVPFLDYWVKARQQGLSVPIEDFSLGAVAAKQNAFAAVTEHSKAFSHASYGYNLDHVPYAEYLRKRAIGLGARTIASAVTDVIVENGRIARVEMPGGQVAEGEFFIDATGPEAALLSKLEDGGSPIVRWSEWLPSDRILAASGPALAPMPAYAQISAFRSGWIGLYPLQDRTAVVAVYDSTNVADDVIAPQLSTLAGLPIEGEAVVAPFEAGARRRHWISNCLGIGTTVASLEPLDAVPAAVIQAGLSALSTLFPASARTMPEAEAYNAQVPVEVERLRDFQISHYRLNKRLGDAFWNAARNVRPPQELASKIDLFAARGAVPVLSHESFGRENWISSFIGHGLIPKSYDPRVDFVSNEKQIEAFQMLLRTIALEVEAMPTVQAKVDYHALPSEPPW